MLSGTQANSTVKENDAAPVFNRKAAQRPSCDRKQVVGEEMRMTSREGVGTVMPLMQSGRMVTRRHWPLFACATATAVALLAVVQQAAAGASAEARRSLEIDAVSVLHACDECHAHATALI